MYTRYNKRLRPEEIMLKYEKILTTPNNNKHVIFIIQMTHELLQAIKKILVNMRTQKIKTRGPVAT